MTIVATIPLTEDVRCHCGSLMELVPCPRHGKRRPRDQWTCPSCQTIRNTRHDGSVRSTAAPLPTRIWRDKAHKAFDPLWLEFAAIPAYQIPRANSKKKRARALSRNQATARRRAYRWLAEQLRMSLDEAHIGMFDEATCRRVVAVCRDVTVWDIHEWAKRKR